MPLRTARNHRCFRIARQGRARSAEGSAIARVSAARMIRFGAPAGRRHEPLVGVRAQIDPAQVRLWLGEGLWHAANNSMAPAVTPAAAKGN